MIIMAIMIIIIRLATEWPPPRDPDGPPHLPDRFDRPARLYTTFTTYSNN